MRIHTAERLGVSERGGAIAEIMTLLSLASILFLTVAFITGNSNTDSRGGTRLAGTSDFECLERTRANDTISEKQSGAFRCFRTFSGNDEIRVKSGDNIVFPGPGNDRVFLGEETGTVEIFYEAGKDVYHPKGKRSLLDLGDIASGDIKMSVSLPTSTSARDRSEFDPSTREPIDLTIATPKGRITVARYFEDQPLTVLVLSDITMESHDINNAAIAGQQTPGSDRILGTSGVDEISPGNGNDRVDAFAGDDSIEYTGGNDTYDAGQGDDILVITGIAAGETSFSIDPNRRDIIAASPRGTLRLVDQAHYPPLSADAKFSDILVGDEVLSSNDLLDRATSDPAAEGAPVIHGSHFDDRILTGVDTRMVDPGHGDDIITYRSGDLVIANTGRPGDRKVLRIDTPLSGPLDVTETEGGDMVIETPGGRITILDQYAHEPETTGVPIDIFKVGDETISDFFFRRR